MLLIYQKFECLLLGIIKKIENQKITLTAWLVSFFAVVFLRSVLESFSSRDNFFHFDSYPFFLFHFPAFFLFLILIIIFILYLSTGEKIERITKIALFAFLLTLLLPIIDLVVTGGQGGVATKYWPSPDMSNGLSGASSLFLETILHNVRGLLFSGQTSSFVDPTSYKFNFGLRIESNIVFLGLIWYIFLKTRNILKVFLGLLFLYFIEFLFSVFSPLKASFLFSSLNHSFISHRVLFSAYFILICILAFFWFFVYNKEKFLAFLKNIRPLRILHNLAMLGLGLYLAKVPIFNPSSFNFADWMLIVTAAVSVALLYLCEIGYGDLYDEKIDKISNPSRPLPSDKITRGEFQSLNNVFLSASLLSAFVAGYSFFVFMLLRCMVGYLYISPPFRLKRFPILATFSRALTFLLTVYAGFLLVSSNTIFDFPIRLAVFILIAFTLGVTVKDIKDYEGDKADKIYTIPVIFGQERGKKIIGILSFIAFLLCPIFFSNYFRILILPALLAGILSFLMINRKEHGKKEVFCLFFIYISFGFFFVLTCF